MTEDEQIVWTDQQITKLIKKQIVLPNGHVKI